MADYPYIPLWTDAYLSDTIHLTTIEHGAYLLLLMCMWRNGGTLPDDDKLLARYSRLDKRQWARIKPVLMPFFEAEDDRLTQTRLTKELVAVRQRSRKATDSANAKWLKNKKTDDANASPRQCYPEPEPEPDKKKRDTNVSSKVRGFQKDFDSWYSAYPHKVGKATAETAFAKAAMKATQEQLVLGLQRYIDTKPPDRPWCNPATWLNQERWKDEPAEVQNGQDDLETERRAARERLRESQRRHREELQANGVGLHESTAEAQGPDWNFD